jgi:hypothetical protein
MIADVVHHRLDRLADSGVRKMWNAVKIKKCGGDNSRINRLTSDVEVVNKYFANISFDPAYKVENINVFKQNLSNVANTYNPLYSYEVEHMLSKITKTAAGSDNIPYWVFSKCSFELADIVAHIQLLSQFWYVT